MTIDVGSVVRVSGGYATEPEWLGQREAVVGQVVGWIPLQGREPACVVRLDDALTATGQIKGVDNRWEQEQSVTGQYLVLVLRWVGQQWSDHGPGVHVHLCEELPDVTWEQHLSGAWVESHASSRALDEAAAE